jgi:hypothetical protein
MADSERLALRNQLRSAIPDDMLDEAVEIAFRMGVRPWEIDEDDIAEISQRVGVPT